MHKKKRQMSQGIGQDIRYMILSVCVGGILTSYDAHKAQNRV